MKKIIIMLIVVAILLTSCSSGVSTEEYNKVKTEYDAISTLSGFRNITFNHDTQLDESIIVSGSVSKIEYKTVSDATKPILDSAFETDVGKSVDFYVTSTENKEYRMRVSFENLCDGNLIDWFNDKSITIIGRYANVGEGSYELIVMYGIMCEGLFFTNQDLLKKETTLELITAKQK